MTEQKLNQPQKLDQPVELSAEELDWVAGGGSLSGNNQVVFNSGNDGSVNMSNNGSFNGTGFRTA